MSTVTWYRGDEKVELIIDDDCYNILKAHDISIDELTQAGNHFLNTRKENDLQHLLAFLAITFGKGFKKVLKRLEHDGF